MLGIGLSDFKEYGCPNCGCDRNILGHFSFDGETTATCKHCGLVFCIMPDNRNISEVSFGTGRRDESGKTIMENIKKIQHPRKNVPKWHYENPDIKPPEGGEYWSPRGIGYDLSGFVKSKQAGERLLDVVKDVLQTNTPETWLDYRVDEPDHIQFKFQKTEFDLEKLYEMTCDTKIINREIIEKCKL